MKSIISILQYALLIYFIVYAIYAIVTSLISRSIIKKIFKRTSKEHIVSTIPVSIIIPAYNEDVVIQDTIKNILHQTYSRYNIIIVNDGSTDSTFQKLKDYLKLTELTPSEIENSCGCSGKTLTKIPTKNIRNIYHSNIPLPSNVRKILVIDKENGGKADAFNAAINVTGDLYMVTVDADTVLIPTAVDEMMQPILKDTRVVAVGAQVGVINNSDIDNNGTIVKYDLPSNWLQGVQALEYMKTFLIYRTGHNVAGASILISGACGLFRTDVIRELCGFDTNSVCEDIEMTMRIQHHIRKFKSNKKVEFVINPVAWTEVPNNISKLSKQRNRWFRGAAHALWKFRGMTLNPKMGTVGLFSTPMYWLFGYLTPFTQLLLFTMLIIQLINVTNISQLIPVLIVGIIVALVINIITISILKYTTTPIKTWKNKLRLFWYGILELFIVQFIYMFINLKASFDALRGNRDWNKFARVGYNIKDGSHVS